MGMSARQERSVKAARLKKQQLQFFKAFGKRNQLRLREAHRGAGVVEMRLRLCDIGEEVGEHERHGKNVAVDRVAPEAATVGKADGVAGFGWLVHALGSGSGLAIEPGLEIGEGGADTPAAAFGDLEGGLLRHGPAGGEEVSQFLRLRRQELHGLEP